MTARTPRRTRRGVKEYFITSSPTWMSTAVSRAESQKAQLLGGSRVEAPPPPPQPPPPCPPPPRLPEDAAAAAAAGQVARGVQAASMDAGVHGLEEKERMQRMSSTTPNRRMILWSRPDPYCLCCLLYLFHLTLYLQVLFYLSYLLNHISFRLTYSTYVSFS